MTEHGEERDELRELWSAEQPPPAVDVDELQRKARRFQCTVLFRNLREWGACALLLPMSLGLIFERPDPLLKAWGVAVFFGILYVARRLWVQGRLNKLPSPDGPTASYLQAYVSQLRQQAMLLRTVPRWYLAPLMLPAVALTLALMVRAHLEGVPVWRGVMVLGWLGGLWGVIALGNSRAARALKEQADTLEAS